MILAYFVNQYPQPSHSFIRREIRALEDLGHVVHRFTARRWPGELVDPIDRQERQATRALLECGPWALIWSLVRMKVTHPIRYWRAVRMALRLSRHGERGFFYHLIYLAEACRLAQWLKTLKVEHLHAHFGTNSTTVALLCGILGGPRWSFTAHGPEEYDKPYSIHLGDKIAHANFVVAISDFGRSQLYRWCPYEQWSKIHIVHCGLDAQFLNQPKVPISDAPRLVCVGRLAPQKGQQLLIAAAAQLAQEGIAFHITIVGDGIMRPHLERLIHQFHLDEKVVLAGWMSAQQVREQMTQSRALVMPSFAEGLPVVIMEALALGRPVIGTQVAGIPDLVLPGQTGWLVPPGDSQSLMEAMREVLSATSEELDRMGQIGAERVALRHNAATEASRLAELFRLQGSESSGRSAPKAAPAR
jgi:glycosyltransferase involved in cell wall biosynthesis